MKTVVELIEMPIANEMRMVAEVREEEIRIERERKEALYEEMLRTATESDMIDFIKFINERIERKTQNGFKSLYINIYNKCCGRHNAPYAKDPRIDFTFEGEFNYGCIKKIEEIYSALGFEVRGRTIYCTNGKAYRDGELYISWYCEE